MSKIKINYTEFTNQAIKFSIEDAQQKFEELCEHTIINNPYFIKIMLKDDDVAPYLSCKYINILIEYSRYL